MTSIPSAATPTVSIVIPTYQEARGIDRCLHAVAAQTYPHVVEVLVVDGGSTDATVAKALAHPGVAVLANPDRIQSAALNVGIAAAKGELIVRVDGHCVIDADYVERCVDALHRTSAAMVGGWITPVASGTVPEAIAAAMASAFGWGPARFHAGGPPGWVDTVFLGAYRRGVADLAGGYDAAVQVNEDAEFAHRMAKHGGVWFDPSIHATYVPRSTLQEVGRQFFRYGRGRARTVVRHPGSTQARQLVAPALVVGLLGPRSRTVAAAYGLGVTAVAVAESRRLPLRSVPAFALCLPVMHLAWGIGFLTGVPVAILRR